MNRKKVDHSSGRSHIFWRLLENEHVFLTLSLGYWAAIITVVLNVFSISPTNPTMAQGAVPNEPAATRVILDIDGTNVGTLPTKFTLHSNHSE